MGLCPTCHSDVGVSGSRVQGADGVDVDGNPVPAWSNDPVLTPEQANLNGDAYRGVQFPTVADIVELQDDRKQREIDLGLLPLTEFSAISSDTVFVSDAHISELRISTERILEASGLSLLDYFNFAVDGNEFTPGPLDTADKDEWTDVDRGRAINMLGLNGPLLANSGTSFFIDEVTLKDVPSLPVSTFVRGMHIEDLRRPLNRIWLEQFSVEAPALSLHFVGAFGIDTFVQEASQFTGDRAVYSLVTNLVVIDRSNTFTIGLSGSSVVSGSGLSVSMAVAVDPSASDPEHPGASVNDNFTNQVLIDSIEAFLPRVTIRPTTRLEVVFSNFDIPTEALPPKGNTNQPNFPTVGDFGFTLQSSLSNGDTFVAGSEAAMLALSAQVGDIAVRTDISTSFILRALPPTSLGNWQELPFPSGPSFATLTADDFHVGFNSFLVSDIIIGPPTPSFLLGFRIRARITAQDTAQSANLSFTLVSVKIR